ncbi:MAG: hypothetical protein IT208_15160 [Chthonomonadales bacterium]|nr:hypothetical protein [Chthonomonadales bacterium]
MSMILAMASLVLAPAPGSVELRSGHVRCAIRGAAIERLYLDGAGKGRFGMEFARDIRPEDWEERPDTRVARSGGTATVGPLRVWLRRHISTDRASQGTYPHLLETGQRIGQTFRVPESCIFTSVSVMLPTWHTATSAATLALYRDGKRIASRRLVNVGDNSWQALGLGAPQGPGRYMVELSDPKGQIGWWSREADVYADGEATIEGQPAAGDRTLLVDARQDVGPGTLTYRLSGATLSVTARQPARQPAAPNAMPWRWRASWMRDGYDCTPAAGVVFSRFFTDTQRYMPVQQLKRRETAGLAFDGCRWIEMEGNRDADPRVEGEAMHLHWELAAREMSLRLDTGVRAAGAVREWRWTLRALPRRDSVPDSFPRFTCSDLALERDLNRFWWERAFTYPAPAGPGAWLEWMPTMRCWFAGPQRDGEMRQLRTYPMTQEGYVHTWGDTVGWPFPGPPYDTRHFDVNARFILGVWRSFRWTGDLGFLRGQAGRLRRAMRYQLDTLKGRDGLIVTASKDVTGLHRGVGNNYWDILPFGHLDAYANAVFYASLTAMEEIERALGEPPSRDWADLRLRCHAAYDATFWDEGTGRYIGCVDVDGGRHDYGFTFVNLEALHYGLGDAAKAARIYRWMEAGLTSSGKADTYARWVFAPRATTIHNPMWGSNAPAAELASPRPPWWHFGWLGTPYGEQCQDGGAILYTSYFDLMDRARYFGADNAWKRFMAIMERYRMPDRLCGGPPLYRGETPQQENPGTVGVDLPFPESGLVPCWFLYGVLGVEPTPAGLRIAPRLPSALTRAGVRGIDWRGMRVTVTATRDSVRVEGRRRDGRPYRRTLRIRPGGGALIPAADAG